MVKTFLNELTEVLPKVYFSGLAYAYAGNLINDNISGMKKMVEDVLRYKGFNVKLIDAAYEDVFGENYEKCDELWDTIDFAPMLSIYGKYPKPLSDNLINLQKEFTEKTKPLLVELVKTLKTALLEENKDIWLGAVGKFEKACEEKYLL